MALRILQLSGTEDVPPTSAGLGVPWQFIGVEGDPGGTESLFFVGTPKRFSDVTKVRE